MSRNRLLPKLVLVGIGFLLLPIVLGFGLLFAILAKRNQEPEFDPRVRHLVTKRMISETERMATQKAPPFRLKDLDGNLHTLEELTSQSPVLVYFIGHECPCSVDAQPMFNAFATEYPHAKVVGIIDCKGEKAAKWVRENQPNHLILIDPSCQTMADYKAEASVYTALVTQSRTIVKMWPGYSQSIMNEISKAIADLIGAQAAVLDRKLAPKETAAGCEFKPVRS